MIILFLEAYRDGLKKYKGRSSWAIRQPGNWFWYWLSFVEPRGFCRILYLGTKTCIDSITERVKDFSRGCIGEVILQSSHLSLLSFYSSIHGVCMGRMLQIRVYLMCLNLHFIEEISDLFGSIFRVCDDISWRHY